MEVQARESNADVLARLMKQGGFLLVVGGGVQELPDRYTRHPQFIFWDDNAQTHEHKEIPANTRGIVYNRWVSHATAGKLRHAAKQLNIPMFPMLKTREIKEVLDELIHEEPVASPVEETIELPDEAPSSHGPLLMKDEVVRKPKQGELKEFIEKHVKGDLSVRGSVASEGRRLFPLLKEAGIKTTEGSLLQAIRVFGKGKGKIRTVSTSGRTAAEHVTEEVDDFTEAEKLLTDARTALDLGLEVIKRLKKELSASRKRQQKLRELLGD